MAPRDLDLGAIVLAAGAATRFGDEPGAKLLTELRGRPVLGHVLAAVEAFAPAATVVVLGASAARVEVVMPWSRQLRVTNPHPEAGLASSLAVGIEALEGHDPLDGAFIVLGDQPLLRVEVLRALADAAAEARPADRPFVVPRYAVPGPRNPVLLLRPAWTTATELDGDRGLGELIDSHPDQVLEVPVGGEMPDVDTRTDLARLEGRSRT